MIAYKPINVIKGKFIVVQAGNLLLKFTSASSSLKYQYNFSNGKREYSKNSKQHTDDSNDLHCTLNKWNNAKKGMQMKKEEYAEVKKKLLGLIKTVNKQSVYFRKVIGLENAPYRFDSSDIEKAHKFENIMPKIDLLLRMAYFKNYMRQDIFKNTAGLVTFQGADWHTFWNKMNPIMIQLKMVKQYIHPEKTITKELMHRIKSFQGTDNNILMDFRQSKAYLILDTKLKCLYENFSDNSIQTRMIDSLLAEKVFVDDSKFDYEIIFQKYFSSPTFKKAMKAYSDQIILIEELIKHATNKINDKNNENHCEEEPTELSMQEKLLNIDKNIAFIVALDLIIAGVDSTSTMIDILYYLTTDESTQEFLENEINTLLSDKKFEVNSDLLNTISYLKTCVKEAYWIYPISAGIIRYLTKDTALSGYQIPIGTLLLFNDICILTSEKNDTQLSEHTSERELRENLNSDISYKKAYRFFSILLGFGSRFGKWRRFLKLKLGTSVTNLMKKFNLSWKGLPSIQTTMSINLLLKPLKFIIKGKKNNT